MNERLFEALAQAKGQPSKALRAVESAGQAGNDILGGYAQGLGIKRQMNEYPLELAQKKAALYTGFGNLAKQVGPDRAAQMMAPVFQGTGIDLPTSQISASDETPEKLANEGEYGATKLGSKEKVLTLQNNAPFSPEIAGYVGNGDIEGLTKYHASRNETVPYREVQQAIAAKRPQFMAGMVGLRGRQALEKFIPSMNPGSQGGIASAVQFASRQGQTLIANPNADPQKIGAASLEYARTILRATPSIEDKQMASYANNIGNNINSLAQRLTNGNYKPEDLPAIRKQLFDNFKELEASSRPLIARQLAEGERQFPEYLPPNWDQTRKSEMGLDLPNIPFNPGGSAQNPNVSTGIPVNPKDPAGLFQ